MSKWIKVAEVQDFVENAGGCIKYHDQQIAVFNFNKQEWFAVQNQCPHQQQMVLSRGLIGSQSDEPKVTCPLHKNAFSLKTGCHLDGNENFTLRTYPVKEKEGAIYLQLGEEISQESTIRSQ